MHAGRPPESLATSNVTMTRTGLLDSAWHKRPHLHVALVASHGEQAAVFVLSPDSPLVVGRAPPADRCIEDPTMSREHARFTLSEGQVCVEDLGSKNGTIVAGRRVTRATLQVGEDVLLGSVVVRVQVLGEQGQSLGLVGEDLFRRRVEEELSRARHFRRPFALMLVRAVEVATSEQAPYSSKSWLEVVRARVRSVDRVALYGVGAVEVLLPETGAEEAERIARELAAPLDRGDIRLLVGLALYPEAGDTPDRLIEAAREAAHRASPEEPLQVGPAGAESIGGPQPGEGDVIAGRSMRSLMEMVERAATSRIPIILHGETGTGKEVLARMIHERGPRSGRRMVRVNCGAIPKDLVESTLFGHERGAFTGALQQQKGVFEEAHGGTVFLDEIGELPPPAQAALLRVLEVGAFNRVGSNREVEVDVRIVAATHRDLEAMAASGAFRADLYYRLSGMVIDIPPLRQRADEIAPLARRFLQMANALNGRKIEGMTPEALSLLQAYSWPGNVRELRNAIERAVVVARGTLVGVEDLPVRMRASPERPEATRPSDPGRSADRVSEPPASRRRPVAPADTPEHGPVRGKVQQYEAQLLRDTLEAAGWNRAEAAKRLGIPVRTLSYRMQVLGLKKPASAAKGGRADEEGR
jgi:DNA-binding NtrC family response regulator